MKKRVMCLDISVVMPIFNAEKYLNETIDSLLRQSYRDFEIILVNDGSTDKSQDVCEEYIIDNPQIRLYNISNHGVSYARNYGLKKANGKYIVFVDADDVVHEEYLAELKKIMDDEQIQLGIVSYSRLRKELEHSKQQKMYFMNKNDLVEGLTTGEMDGYLWNKIFKTNIIKNNTIYFDENLTIWEDLLFVLRYISCIDYAIFNTRVLYYYRKTETGATSAFSIDKQLACLEACKRMCNQKFGNNNHILRVYSQKVYIESQLTLCIMYLKKKQLKCVKKYFEQIDESFDRSVISFKYRSIYLGLGFICRFVL